ncbi:MAG TPA: Asp-tRNA(Asn)/Glu-tRNA(Gln) amidotransferase subunit GatA [Thermovirgaceae bacterium]|nr:Asp-tRNA(Asn)/Glu-tRNA(Gln) amidotransferase subunit GatA [Thermovirgaceae bacterium]
MAFNEMDAARIASGIREAEFSAREVIQSSISRIRSLEPTLNAIITPLFEEALSRADRVDRIISEGGNPGPLGGVPVVVKDNMCMKGIPTTCGSRILEGWKPPYDASVVSSLEEAGAVIIGKSNMDEFAMGSSTEHSAYGPTSNPRDTGRVPGGSSGGSAASVAAGYVPIALGSDTGGSIRQPAAFCGVHGLKPTYGLVSRWGLVAFASSLDQIGPFARSISDMALVLDVISNNDPRDSTCSSSERPSFSDCIKDPSVRGKKVGIVREFIGGSLDPSLKGAIEKTASMLEASGAEIVDVALPMSGEYGLPCYYIIAPAEASSNLSRFDGVRYGMRAEASDLITQYIKTRGSGFGEEVQRRILTGTFALSSGYYDAYYLLALKVRRLICSEFARAFERADVILMPASPTLPFRKGELVDDPISMYMSDVFTLPVNLAGLPGITVFTGFEGSGLPLGVQLVAPRFQDSRLLEFAGVIESWAGRPGISPGGDK